MFNKYGSVCFFLYNYVILRLSVYYLWWLVGVLFLFLMYRMPYCYRPYWFGVVLVGVVFRMFLSLFLNRLFSKIKSFFSRLVPVGTPLYICPLVCLAERVSYMIRPIVLILRPFINIRLGCFGAVALCGLCMANWVWMIFLVILFFYEVFVAIVHWYIVVKILLFSIDH